MRMRGRLSSRATVQGDIYRSGGGSTISITPTYNSGTKIADYNIDGTEGAIYIPENGYSETVLFSNNDTSNPSTISLTDSLFNYDEIKISSVRTFDGVPNSIINSSYLVSNLSLNYIINLLGWSGNNEFILYKIISNTTLSLHLQGNYLYIDKITGIKY